MIKIGYGTLSIHLVYIPSLFPVFLHTFLTKGSTANSQKLMIIEGDTNMDKFYPQTSLLTIVLPSSTNILYEFLVLTKLFGFQSHLLTKKASSQESMKVKCGAT